MISLVMFSYSPPDIALNNVQGEKITIFFDHYVSARENPVHLKQVLKQVFKAHFLNK